MADRSQMHRGNGGGSDHPTLAAVLAVTAVLVLVVALAVMSSFG